MRRIALMMIALLFTLTACGGGSADTTVPAPPAATVIERSDNAKIQQTLDGLKSAIPQQMTTHKIIAETIQQQTYQSTATLPEIASFYDRELVAKGWVKSQRMPEPLNGVLVTGYEINTATTTLSITAIDATQVGGTGTIIYTAKGSTS